MEDKEGTNSAVLLKKNEECYQNDCHSSLKPPWRSQTAPQNGRHVRHV